MSSSLAAFVYVVLAVALGWAAARVCFPESRSSIWRIAVSWLTLSFIWFLMPNGLVVMLLTGIVLYFAAPKESSERILYYCAMLLALPELAYLRVPFPGINYLIALSYPALLNLVVLFPMCFGEKTSGQERVSGHSAHNRVIWFLWAYLLLTVVLDFRLTTFTNGAREGLQQLIIYGIPVAALAKVAVTREVVEKAAFGMLIAGVLAFFVGVMQLVSNWYFYLELPADLLHLNMPYYELFRMRAGQVRMPSTMTPIPFGVYMAICVGIALYFAGKDNAKKLIFALIPLFLAGVVFSASRGAVLTLLILVTIMWLYTPKFAAYRWLIGLFGAGTAVVAVFVFDVIQMVIDADPYGTFVYRWELIINSIDSIKLNPLFGTPDFLTNPTESLERSRQGQGIIDIVNAYLQFILRYGIFGLALITAAIVTAMRSISAARRDCESRGDRETERLIRLMQAILFSFAIAITTVSLVDRLYLYLFVIVVLASVCGIPSFDPGVRTRKAHTRSLVPEY